MAFEEKQLRCIPNDLNELATKKVTISTTPFELSSYPDVLIDLHRSEYRDQKRGVPDPA